MPAIIINSDIKSNRLLADLARRLGGEVTELKEDQLEDIMLGSLMDKVRTGKDVSRDRIMRLLSDDR